MSRKSVETIAGVASGQRQQKVRPRKIPSPRSPLPRCAVRWNLRLPSFRFESFGTLDDAALGDGECRTIAQSTSVFGASDLHLSTGARPFIRKDRVLSYISDYVLTSADALRIKHGAAFGRTEEDFSRTQGLRTTRWHQSGPTAYRVNLMFHKNGAPAHTGWCRRRPSRSRPSAYTKHLETPEKDAVLPQRTHPHHRPVARQNHDAGLDGRLLNDTRFDHIITVEDPIEVVQPARGCNVTQREVGPHTRTFASALKGALREDPDVIVIGDCANLRRFEMAISASETGHLVTARCIRAMPLRRSTAARRFSAGSADEIRASVAESLRGMSASDCCRAHGRARPRLRDSRQQYRDSKILSVKGKSTGLRNTMETGVKEGMCLMDNVVFGLLRTQDFAGCRAFATSPTAC
jgi:twitching motility protein PilT